MQICLLVSKDDPEPTRHIASKIRPKSKKGPVGQECLLKAGFERSGGLLLGHAGKNLLLKGNIDLCVDGIEKIHPYKEPGVAAFLVRDMIVVQEVGGLDVVLSQPQTVRL